MKEHYLTIKNVKHGLTFLQKRKAHAKKSKNESWVKEYENIIRIIKELTTIEV